MKKIKKTAVAAIEKENRGYGCFVFSYQVREDF